MLLQMLLLAVVAIWMPSDVTALPLDTSAECPFGDNNEEAQGISLCLTPECVSWAGRILQTIDTTVDPCDNFYDFACGGWLKDQILPQDASSMSVFESEDKMIATVRTLLMEESKPSELSAVKKAKDFFASCMNYAHDPEAVHPLKDFIDREFGGWPLTLDDWDESEFDLGYALRQAARYGVSPIFSFGVDSMEFIDYDNTPKSFDTLTIGAPNFGLPGADLYSSKEDRIIQAYRDRINITADSFLGSLFEDEIESLLDLEIALAQRVVEAKAAAEESGEEERTMSLSEVADQYSDIIDWNEFITGMMSLPEVGITEVKDNENIRNTAPGYFEAVSNYLPAVTNTTLANYIVWRVIDTFENARIPEDIQVSMMVQQAANLVPTYPAEKGCVHLISKFFGLIVHRLLYDDLFPKEEMDMVKEMMHNIQDALDEGVEHVDWADEYTKKQIRDKNAALKINFIYFDRVMNNTYLENYYANMTFNRETYFENLVVEKQESVIKNLSLFGQPVQRKIDVVAYEQEAYYEAGENAMSLSATQFDPPFFSKNVPQSLNYGGIGATLGHELLHGFDDAGHKYNKDGEEGQWWSEQSELKFQESLTCMIKQYDQFHDPEAKMNINGTQTIGENLADQGGLKQAFHAYKKWLCSQGKDEPRLPGMNYTHPQLFFISFAHTSCTLNSKERLISLIEEDGHSPFRFRVIGAAQNSVDFAKAFKCPADSYMNPQKKCQVF